MMSRINLFLNERTEGEKYATVFYCIVHADGTLPGPMQATVHRFWCARTEKLRILKRPARRWACWVRQHMA